MQVIHVCTRVAGQQDGSAKDEQMDDLCFHKNRFMIWSKWDTSIDAPEKFKLTDGNIRITRKGTINNITDVSDRGSCRIDVKVMPRSGCSDIFWCRCFTHWQA